MNTEAPFFCTFGCLIAISVRNAVAARALLSPNEPTKLLKHFIVAPSRNKASDSLRYFSKRYSHHGDTKRLSTGFAAEQALRLISSQCVC